MKKYLNILRTASWRYATTCSEHMRDVDLLVYGRKTYELMVPFWPDVAKNQSMTRAANELAQTFDSINKIVFSQSLASAEGKNTRIVRTKLQGEILKSKQEPGKNILSGGVSRDSLTASRPTRTGTPLSFRLSA